MRSKADPLPPLRRASGDPEPRRNCLLEVATGNESLLRRPAGSIQRSAARHTAGRTTCPITFQRATRIGLSGARAIAERTRELTSRPATPPTGFNVSSPATQVIPQTAGDCAAAQAYDQRTFYELLTEMARPIPDGEWRQKRGHPWPVRTSHGQQSTAKNGRMPWFQRADRRAESVSPRSVLAEGVGFEPTRGSAPTRSPGVRLRPLGHPSERARPY
jgi:hypothetical protein